MSRKEAMAIMGYYDGWGAMGWLGGLMMLLFWGGLVLLVLPSIQALGSAGRPHRPEDALATLRRRYAAGEITQAEYELARRALG